MLALKKKKVIICLMVMIICIITILIVIFISRKEKSSTKSELLLEDNNNNPLIEISVPDEEVKLIRDEMISITKNYINECGSNISVKNRDEKRKEYAKYLENQGYTVGTDFYNGELANYEEFKIFCEKVDKDVDSGKKMESEKFDLYYIQVDGSLLKYHFEYINGKVIFTASTSYIDDTDKSIKAPFITRYELYTFDYTDKGWLFIEQYAKEGNEMNGHQAIRVEPFNSEYKELCEKYVEKIGYQCNNLFISEWNENEFDKINFNDLYEFLYYEKTGEELDHDVFYDGIPENEFCSLVNEYFNINDEKIKEISKFDKENGVFPWARIGCLSYSPDISGEPIAEVVDKRENPDGTFTLVIDAVWEWYNTDKAFTQELTIRPTENEFNYVSNHIIPSENNIIPIYKNRI